MSNVEELRAHSDLWHVIVRAEARIFVYLDEVAFYHPLHNGSPGALCYIFFTFCLLVLKIILGRPKDDTLENKMLVSKFFCVTQH